MVNFEGPISRKNEKMHCLGWCPIMTPVKQSFINGSWFQILFFFPNVHPENFWGSNFLPSWRACAYFFKGGWWVQPPTRLGRAILWMLGALKALPGVSPQGLDLYGFLKVKPLWQQGSFPKQKKGSIWVIYRCIYIWLWKLCLKVKRPWDTLVKSWCIYNKPRVSCPWVERKHVFQSIMFIIHLNFPGCNLFMKL